MHYRENLLESWKWRDPALLRPSGSIEERQKLVPRWGRVSSKQREGGVVTKDLISHSDIGQQHPLLHSVVRLSELVMQSSMEK